jgi:acetolactate synthase I/II/III large subunit
MNRLSGAEALVRMLDAYGVRHVFGLCGDTSLPLYDALVRLDHGIEHILMRDERSAGYAADAYARISGRIGVCEGPSGGGATYICPGVVEANESSIGLIAITSDIATTARGRYTLTELDQEALFRPLTKWNAVIDRAERLPGLVRRAFREAAGGRPGAVHLALPLDAQTGAVDEEATAVEPELGAFPARRMAPDRAAVERALRILDSAERPLILVGGGVLTAGAFEALRRLAESLGAPVATAISGKGAIADGHPLALGVVGSNGGTPETREVIDRADLVLAVGCRLGSVTTQGFRHPRQGTPLIHADIDPAVIGATYPGALPLPGDARLALAALADGVKPRPGWGEAAVAAARAAKRESFMALARSDELPIRPERVVAALQAALPDDWIVCADPGTPCPYLAAYLEQAAPGRRCLSNRAHGALGWAMSAAIGAAHARPEAKVVAVMGDGSFAMTAGELETIARLQLPITLVVIANATFGWIKAGQKTGFGGRYFGVDFGASDHAAIARAFGIGAERVEEPDRLEPALARALRADRPMLVDIVTQPLHEARAPVSAWVA